MHLQHPQMKLCYYTLIITRNNPRHTVYKKIYSLSIHSCITRKNIFSKLFHLAIIKKKKNPIFFITSKFKGKKKKKKRTWTCNNSSETSPINALSNIFGCGRR